MFDVEWSSLVTPTHSLAEIFLRGSVIYLALFLAFRFLPRREMGGLSASDIVVVVLIADAVQDAMSAGGYDSVIEGLILAASIFFWSTFVDWLDFKFPQLNIAAPRPSQVIRNGKLLRRNMDKQHVTEDELMSQLREHGVDTPERVAAAFVEGDGHFSVILRRGAPTGAPSQQTRGAAGD